MTYSEMLRHPMWQRKRLEALEKADFAYLQQRGAHPQQWAEDGLLALVPAAQEEAA